MPTWNRIAHILLLYFIGLYAFFVYNLIFLHPSPIMDVGHFMVGFLCIGIIFFGVQFDNFSGGTDRKYMTLFYIFSMVAAIVFCLTLVDMLEASEWNRIYLIPTWILAGWLPSIFYLTYFFMKSRTTSK